MKTAIGVALLALLVSSCGVLPRSRPAVARSQPLAPPCVDVDSLPSQTVGDGRIIHLGADSPGSAPRVVSLCPRREPVLGVRFKVRSSGVQLNCAGVVFDGSDRDGVPGPQWALDVDRTARPGIHDVTIEQCVFRGYRRGVLLVGPDIAAPDAGAAALHHFTLRDVSVIDSRGEGIYVGAHSHDFLFERVTVQNSYVTGLYLDAQSHDVVVRDSRFIHNGHSACSLGREGVAIDASGPHTIERTVFEDNRYAGVTLYKNCGESDTPRTTPASGNRIVGNTFRGHQHPRGAAVIVAARQGMDPAQNDCVSHGCVDPGVLGERRRDFARDNVISGNTFERNLRAIQVFDGPNLIEDNTFVDCGGPDDQAAAIEIGSDMMEALGEPVANVRVLRNRFDAASARSLRSAFGAEVESVDNRFDAP